LAAERWVDLHAHTTCSDGSDTPEAVVALAAARGLALLAIADHITAEGVPAARAAGAAIGMPVVPAVEFNAACARGELHLLAYGVDLKTPALTRLLARSVAISLAAHQSVLRRLQRAGYALDVDPAGLSGLGLHVATRTSLLSRGHAKDRRDAYASFLAHPDYFTPAEYPAGEEVLAAVASAGGLAALAHPCRLRVQDEPTVARLAAAGLWGIEVYYGDGGEPYIPRALELARRYRLRPTIGSDYHGVYRKPALGMRVPDDPSLWETLEILADRA
jgi:predicted metal-dependent phosphoesterase TrpH